MRYIQERHKDELNVFKQGYLPLKYWKNWFNNIEQFFQNVKFAWQRATRGYCDRDVWNLDNYYLMLFYHTLKHLSKYSYSYPGVDEFADENGGYEAWQKYLSDMADHFENAEEWNEDIDIVKESELLWNQSQEQVESIDFKPCENDCCTMVTKYKDEEAYNKAHQAWLNKLSEGHNFRETEKNIALNMLKKVFFNLWD